MVFLGFKILHGSHFFHNTLSFFRISRSQTVIKAKTNLATDKVLNSYCGLYHFHKQFQNMLIRFTQFFPRTKAYWTLEKLYALDLKDTLNLLKTWQSKTGTAMVGQLSAKTIQMTHKNHIIFKELAQQSTFVLSTGRSHYSHKHLSLPYLWKHQQGRYIYYYSISDTKITRGVLADLTTKALFLFMKIF